MGLIAPLLFLCSVTCLIEMIPLSFLRNKSKWIKTSLICNVVTNPLINVALALLSTVINDALLYIVITVVLEIAVIAFEAFIYYNVMDESVRKCLLVSLLANFCSFAVGAIAFFALEALSQPSYHNNFDNI